MMNAVEPAHRTHRAAQEDRAHIGRCGVARRRRHDKVPNSSVFLDALASARLASKADAAARERNGAACGAPAQTRDRCARRGESHVGLADFFVVL